jgi:methylphosphotriester-DNA--protein-cysteine methyltransferase
MCPILNGFRPSVRCKDEQHAMSSQELQSALMLTVEFSKNYYTR